MGDDEQFSRAGHRGGGRIFSEFPEIHFRYAFPTIPFAFAACFVLFSLFEGILGVSRWKRRRRKDPPRNSEHEATSASSAFSFSAAYTRYRTFIAFLMLGWVLYLHLTLDIFDSVSSVGAAPSSPSASLNAPAMNATQSASSLRSALRPRTACSLRKCMRPMNVFIGASLFGLCLLGCASVEVMRAVILKVSRRPHGGEGRRGKIKEGDKNNRGRIASLFKLFKQRVSVSDILLSLFFNDSPASWLESTHGGVLVLSELKSNVDGDVVRKALRAEEGGGNVDDGNGEVDAACVGAKAPSSSSTSSSLVVANSPHAHLLAPLHIIGFAFSDVATIAIFALSSFFSTIPSFCILFGTFPCYYWLLRFVWTCDLVARLRHRLFTHGKHNFVAGEAEPAGDDAVGAEAEAAGWESGLLFYRYFSLKSLGVHRGVREALEAGGCLPPTALSPPTSTSKSNQIRAIEGVAQISPQAVAPTTTTRTRQEISADSKSHTNGYEEGTGGVAAEGLSRRRGRGKEQQQGDGDGGVAAGDRGREGSGSAAPSASVLRHHSEADADEEDNMPKQPAVASPPPYNPLFVIVAFFVSLTPLLLAVTLFLFNVFVPFFALFFDRPLWKHRPMLHPIVWFVFIVFNGFCQSVFYAVFLFLPHLRRIVLIIRNVCGGTRERIYMERYAKGVVMGVGRIVLPSRVLIRVEGSDGGGHHLVTARSSDGFSLGGDEEDEE